MDDFEFDACNFDATVLAAVAAARPPVAPVAPVAAPPEESNPRRPRNFSFSDYTPPPVVAAGLAPVATAAMSTNPQFARPPGRPPRPPATVATQPATFAAPVVHSGTAWLVPLPRQLLSPQLIPYKKYTVGELGAFFKRSIRETQQEDSRMADYLETIVHVLDQLLCQLLKDKAVNRSRELMALRPQLVKIGNRYARIRKRIQPMSGGLAAALAYNGRPCSGHRVNNFLQTECIFQRAWEIIFSDGQIEETEAMAELTSTAAAAWPMTMQEAKRHWDLWTKELESIDDRRTCRLEMATECFHRLRPRVDKLEEVRAEIQTLGEQFNSLPLHLSDQELMEVGWTWNSEQLENLRKQKARYEETFSHLVRKHGWSSNSDVDQQKRVLCEEDEQRAMEERKREQRMAQQLEEQKREEERMALEKREREMARQKAQRRMAQQLEEKAQQLKKQEREQRMAQQLEEQRQEQRRKQRMMQQLDEAIEREREQRKREFEEREQQKRCEEWGQWAGQHIAGNRDDDDPPPPSPPPSYSYAIDYSDLPPPPPLADIHLNKLKAMSVDKEKLWRSGRVVPAEDGLSPQLAVRVPSLPLSMASLTKSLGPMAVSLAPSYPKPGGSRAAIGQSKSIQQPNSGAAAARAATEHKWEFKHGYHELCKYIVQNSHKESPEQERQRKKEEEEEKRFESEMEKQFGSLPRT